MYLSIIEKFHSLRLGAYFSAYTDGTHVLKKRAGLSHVWLEEDRLELACFTLLIIFFQCHISAHDLKFMPKQGLSYTDPSN